jgi:hypothetical protein
LKKNNRNKGLVILAGGSIGHRLPFISNAAVNTAMIPVGLRPAIAYLFDFYVDQVSEIIVICNSESALDIQTQWDILSNQNKIAVDLKVIAKNTAHVIDSLRLASSEMMSSGLEDWIVSPVTTIPTQLVNRNSYVLEDDVRASAGWSFIMNDAKGPQFISRNSKDDFHLGHAFTGVFRAEKDDLVNCLLCLDSNDLIDVISYLVCCHDYQSQFAEWIDIGHAVNYYHAKSKIVASRHFNSIDIDPVKGLVIKRSQKIEKIQNESKYVTTLPKQIQIWYPRQIGDVKICDGWAIQKMEYYAYPVVSELFLYWHLESSQWQQLIKSVSRLLGDFKAYPVVVSEHEHQDLYVSKLFERVDQFSSQVHQLYPQIFTGQTIVVNDVELYSLPFLREWICTFSKNLYRKEDHCLMHGDLCFNNILYDPYGGTLRLIDPRGGMSVDSINLHAGDIKYDLAKFAHSAIYGYDFIVAGQFKLNFSEHIFCYEIFNNKNSDTMTQMTADLFAEFHVNPQEIDFIVGMLFVSMTSLHVENSERQLLMYLHGLSILNRVYKNHANMH